MIFNLVHIFVFWIGLVFIVFFVVKFFIAIPKLFFSSGHIKCKQIFKSVSNKEKRDFIIGILTFMIAYLAYFKANEFLDTWLLFQISDRCLAANIKINEETGRIYPVFINQGGDSLAYESLVGKYNDSIDKNLKNKMAKHLLKIYENIASVENYFQEEYFTVNRTNHKGSWTFNREWPFETWDEFDIPNVIEQLRHPTYWTTRARCAKLLQNAEYLKDKKGVNKENLGRLKDYDWARMFDNLIKNIQGDYSLIVRKESLDTYKLWVCSVLKDNVSKQKCENKFVSDNIYHFESAVEDWQKNRTKIVGEFKRNSGI